MTRPHEAALIAASSISVRPQSQMGSGRHSLLEGLRGEVSTAELCRKEGIAQSMDYGFTMRIFSAAEYYRRVALRMSRTNFSAPSGLRPFPFVIVIPPRGYDEPGTLAYAISSICPESADEEHPARFFGIAGEDYGLVPRPAGLALFHGLATAKSHT